jgi:hypothetical protein
MGTRMGVVISAWIGCISLGGANAGGAWAVDLTSKAPDSIQQARQLEMRALDMYLGDYNAAEGIVWPDFVSEHPRIGALYFANPSQPDEPLALSAALDRSDPAKDVYDILYIDADLDKAMGERERLEGKPCTEPEMGGAIDFGLIMLSIPGCRPFQARLWHDGSTGVPEDLMVHVLGWRYLEGVLDMDGVANPIRLLDYSFDGSFATDGGDGLVIGDTPPRALSKTLPWKGLLLDVELAEDGSRITFSPYEGEAGVMRIAPEPASGKIRSIWTWIQAADGQPMSFEVEPGELVRVPAGTYGVYLNAECVQGEKAWLTTARWEGVEVPEGEETVLHFGKPLSLAVDLSESTRPGATLSVACSLRGASDEQYSAFYSYAASENRATADFESHSPKVVIRDSAGEIAAEGILEPG